MSELNIKSIKSDLLVDLSTTEQELISGGQILLGGQTRPDITVNGVLTDSSGQRIPVRILGFVAGPPLGEPRPFGFPGGGMFGQPGGGFPGMFGGF